MLFSIMENENCRSAGSSIVELPLLVLAKIFKHLRSKERETAMKVCQRWDDIITFEVGLTRYIGEMKYSLPGHRATNWMPISVIGKTGIEKCIFGELDTISSDDNDNDEMMTSFLLPELVKELTFIGGISYALFERVMAPVYWLNILNIHLIVLRSGSFANFSLKLYSLSKLKIFYTHPTHSLSCPFTDRSSLEREMVHGNLMKLLESSYLASIKTFEFSGPYFFEKMECLVGRVREFSRRHEKSLNELIIRFPYEWNVTLLEQRQYEKNLMIQNGKLEEENGRKEDRRIGSSWGNVQLTRLTVACPTTVVPPLIGLDENMNEVQMASASAWAGEKLSSTWKSLLSNQSHLELLQYVNKCEKWRFPQYIFSNGACHLTTICLSINSHHPVDCKALSVCKNLSTLTLEGNFFHGEDFETNNIIPPDKDEITGLLLNAHHLPQSLKEICFSKMLVPVEELNVIANAEEAKRFPNLKSLQLYQVCKSHPQCGLTPSSVESLFAQQSNLSLSFWQALNKPSFQRAVENLSQNVATPDVETLRKMLEYCDDAESENIQFSQLNDCHIQLIRRNLPEDEEILHQLFSN